MCKYSIVVPCYISGEWLDEFVQRIEKALSSTNGGYELILVNDASPDSVTWPAIKKNAEQHAWVHGIDLQFNVGQFRALMSGLEAAKGEFVVTMDDDLQHPPEEIPKLIAAIQDKPDVDAVIGCYRTKQHSLYRNLGRRLVNSLFRWLYGQPRGVGSTSFRIMRRGLVDAVIAHRTVKPVPGALILQSTRRIMNIPVDHESRTRGKSGYRLSRLVGHTLDNIFNSSTAPLRAISLLGTVVALGAFLLGIGYFVRWRLGMIGQPGFTTIVLLTSFFGGLILCAIGIVGEYVARVVAEVTGTPRYIVRERAD